MTFLLGHVNEQRLNQIAVDAQQLPLTYELVGSTRVVPGDLAGYRLDRYSIELGTAPHVFDRGCNALRQWEAHIGAGARVAPADAPLQVGQSVVVALALLGVTAIAPCRIVWVDDEVDRFGFGYGTLSGHPEQGEESFVITRTAGGVRFEITAFSRPAALLAKLGQPVARRIQSRITNRYLTGLKTAVDRRS